MNSLERTLITKAGYDHGWEIVIEDVPTHVTMASALHQARVHVAAATAGEARWAANFNHRTLERELSRSAESLNSGGAAFLVADERELGVLLRQAARLARSLPDAPEIRFERAVTRELATHAIQSTEVERLVRQRIGQDIFRESLMDYWGGACAVSGVTIPELLRASHTKPWTQCSSDAERLNVFNGFLLAAHLDALFDRHLMTFGPEGDAVFAPVIDRSVRAQLGLTDGMKLRWVRDEHQTFLDLHRAEFMRLTGSPVTDS